MALEMNIKMEDDLKKINGKQPQKNEKWKSTTAPHHHVGIFFKGKTTSTFFK
jgi:hypothetical protein